MGISASWISASGLDRAAFLERLGLTETSDTLAITRDWFPRRCVGGVATLADGRQLFVSSYADLATPDVAQRVSAGAELVMCSMEEHVMFSEAFGYSDGRRKWLIRHDPDKDLHGVETEGDPPTTLAAALARAAQGEKDHPTTDYFFGVPMDVVGPIAGYRADEDFQGFAGEVTIVERKGKGGIMKWLRGNW